MKRPTKNLLTGIGLVSISFAAYVLWAAHAKKIKQEREAREAAKRAEFIERRRAYVRKKSAAEVTEAGAGQVSFTDEPSEADASENLHS